MQLRLFQKWVKKNPVKGEGYFVIKSLPDKNGTVTYTHKEFTKFKVLNGTTGKININLLYKEYRSL